MEVKASVFILLLIQFTFDVNCYDIYKRFYENCFMRTKLDTCCDTKATVTTATPVVTSISNICSYDMASKRHICTADGNSGSQCLLNSQPYFGFAHPLGFMSGMITSSQISSSSPGDSSRNIRLFSTGLGWSISAGGYIKIQFAKKMKIAYIVFQYNGVTSSPKFHIKDGNDATAHYQTAICNGILFREACRHLLEQPPRTSSLTIESIVQINFFKIELGGMEYLQPDHLWRFDTILYHSGSSKPHLPNERGDLQLVTSMMDTKIVSTSTLIFQDLTLQSISDPNQNRALATGGLIVKKCRDSLSECKEFTLAFWAKGPFIDYTITESSPEGAFQLTLHGSLLSYEIKQVGKFKATVSDCTCWKHFIAVKTTANAVQFYENGKKLSSVLLEVPASTITETNLLVSPLKSFRNFAWWNFALNDAEASDVYNKGESFMDFKITAFEDFGDWKTATTLCASTNQGPCFDYSVSQKSEAAAEVPLEFTTEIPTSYFYDFASHLCTVATLPATLYPGYYSLLDIPIDLTVAGIEVERLRNAVIKLKTSLNIIGRIEIYAVRSYDYNDNYSKQCRSKFFDNDVKVGPIYWDNPTSDSEFLTTPDLAEIFNPLLAEKEHRWTKEINVVMKIIVLQKLDIALSKIEAIFGYTDRTPERFLYADLKSASGQGQPLTYKTRYYPPVKQCLKFWYHMNGPDAGYLAVHLEQSTLLKEVFRIFGNQEMGWKEANVPLSDLDASGAQFRIAFLASRGESVKGSIAIDNIALEHASCDYKPSFGKPAFHTADTIANAYELLKMEEPLFLVPMHAESYGDLYKSTVNFDLNQKLTIDMYGYPLKKNHFPATEVKIKNDSLVDVSNGFSLAIQVKPEQMTSSVLVGIEMNDNKRIMFSMEPDGNLSTNFVSSLLPLEMFTVSTSNIFTNNTWVNLVVTYYNGFLTVYANATKASVHNVSEYIDGMGLLLKGLKLGENGVAYTKPIAFNGYMACFQFYRYELQIHEVMAIGICPDRISSHACRTKCKDDGSCNAITGKCICPKYANKYINSDSCSSKLESTLYGKSVSIVKFDGIYELKKRLGRGMLFKNSASLYNAFISGKASDLNFAAVPGPVNLAICTGGTKKFSLQGLKSCLLNKTCTVGFAVSVWVQPPPKSFIAEKDTVIVDIGAFKLLYGTPLCNDATAPGYKFQFESGGEICTWSMGVNCTSSQAWTQLLISFDNTNSQVFAIENGIMTKAVKYSCTAATPSPVEAAVGGSAMHVCIDELVLWDAPLKASLAIKNSCVFGHCGMASSPSTINFKLTTFDQTSESLWSLDVYGKVYHYNKGVWVAVDKEMNHLSAGGNGVFGIGKDFKLYQRDGITTNNKGGTTWKLLSNEPVWKKVESSYKHGFIYLIDSIDKLYNFKIDTKAKIHLNDNNIRILGISCAEVECWMNRQNEKDRKLTIFGGTDSFSNTVSPQSSQIIISRHNDLATLTGSVVKRYKYQDNVLKQDDVTTDIKHISFVFSEIWAVTNDGKLKIIKNNDQDSFTIRHFNGKYVTADVSKSLKERPTHFVKEGDFCLNILPLRLYLWENNGGLSYYGSCNLDESVSTTKFAHLLDSSVRRNFNKEVLYLDDSTKPVKFITNDTFMGQNSKAENGQFYFMFDSLKGASSFYPQRIRVDSFDGAIKVQINVQFTLNDYKYIGSFHDKQGVEATMIYSKVQEELYQIFRDCPFYMDVNFDEIKFLKNIELWCHNFGTPPKDVCNLPMVVQFTGNLKFGHISEVENKVLSSAKLSGKETDCQGNRCWLRVIGSSSGYCTDQPNIKVVNTTVNGTSDATVTVQYQEDAYCTSHTGYNIHSVERSLIDPTQEKTRSGKTTESTTFFLKYPLYYKVSLSVTPLHVQNSVMKTVVLTFDTPATKPNIAPTHLACGSNGQTGFKITIKEIPWSEWNGQPLKYNIFYKKTTWDQELNLHTGPFTPGNMTTYALSVIDNFQDSSTQNIDGLEIFTKYEVFVGGVNSVGLGPLRRIVCRTDEGVPEAAPKNVRIQQNTSSSVVLTWSPLPNDPEIWNNEDTATRQYRITYDEYTKSDISERIYDTTHPWHEIEGLQAGRGYQFVIAATSNLGPGVKTDYYCIRLLETAPEALPSSISVSAENASSISIKISPISDLYHENGVIRYYNISMEEFNTYDTILGLPTSRFFHIVYLERDSPDSSLVTQKNSSNVAVKCESNYRESHPKTSTKKLVTIANLRYFTRYRVGVSACTLIGCSQFNTADKPRRTEEFHPTCPPLNASVLIRSSTSLVLNWINLEDACINGFLSHYRIRFAEKEAFTTQSPIEDPLWPDFNATLYQEKFSFVFNPSKFTSVENTNIMSLNLTGLKKFVTYCFQVSGFTKVGGGPYSNVTCAKTLQDYPDAPPTNFTVASITSTSLLVKMCPPVPEKVNGLVTHYTVFYSILNNSDVHNATAFTGNETCTQTVIIDLRKFTDYRLKVAASTHIGIGPKSDDFAIKRTLEDVPSACLQNISSFRFTEKDSFVSWQNVPEGRLHGMQRGFKIEITEQLQDGVIFLRRNFFINQTGIKANNPYEDLFKFNVTLDVSNVYVTNNNESLNRSAQFFYLKLVGLKAYALYNVSLSSCTTPGCGPQCSSVFLTKETAPSGIVQDLKTSVTNSTTILIVWKPLSVIERHGLIIYYKIHWINTCLMRGNASLNETEKCVLSLSHKTDHYGNVTVPGSRSLVLLKRFVPFTQYEFTISALTSEGKGPEVKWTVDTPEDVPSVAPDVMEVYNTSSTSIKLNWTEIPYEYRNGILLGHKLRFLESHLVSDNSAYQEVFLRRSINVFYVYEIKSLQRHTLYNILISAVTSKGDGSIRNITVKTGPYVNGRWTDWTPWTFCSVSCGGGIKYRKRSCTNPRPWNGGDDCIGNNLENRTCNNHLCSGKFLTSPNEDCNVTCSSRGLVCIKDLQITPTTPESAFSHAATPCKIVLNSWSSDIHSGLIENTATCVGKPTWLRCTEGNTPTTRRICNCYDRGDLGYGEWAAWSFCSRSCGGGIKTRTRSCLLGHGKCDGADFSKLECNEDPCPVDGNWGSWSGFQSCNKSCGYGYRHRYRHCDSPAPYAGGRNCPGTAVDAEGGCNPEICPVNGGWSEFGSFGMCSQPCGNGVAIRKRYCNSPKPAYGGISCQGSNEDSKPCNPHPCSGVEVKCKMKIEMEWNYKYFYLNSHISIGLIEECRRNLKSLYSNASVIAAIKFHNFYKGSVVANFSIFYEAVKNVEVLILQDAISTQKKVGNLTVSQLLGTPVSALPEPPYNLTASGLSPFSIGITWKFNRTAAEGKNLSSFYVFVRKQDSAVGSWNVIGIPLHLNSFNITDLQAVTTYRMRMSVSGKFANGVASEEVLGTTLEGVPEKSIEGLQLQAFQPTEVYLEWKTMKEIDYNGHPRGYVIRYKGYDDTSFKEKLAEYGSSSDTVKGLKPFTIHIFEIMAYTNVGRGPPIADVIKTLEGQPEIPPPNVRVEDYIATDQVIIKWSAIPIDKYNGIFRGYKLRYAMLSSGSRVLVPKGKSAVITTDKFTFEYKISGLQSYSSYEITISGYTDAGEGPSSKAVIASTCKCPKTIFLNWFESRPYVVKDGPFSVEGIFTDIITETIETSCGVCNGRKPVISTFQSRTGENPEKPSELGVKNAIGKEYHISFPVRGSSEMTRYLGVNAFVTLVKSTGIATVVRNELDHTAKTKAAFGAMVNVWPMYIIYVLTTLVAGIIIWFFEHMYNEDFSKEDYLSGIFQGFWWAFISATTVGYGDIAPKTFLGRIFGIIWTLIALVLNGILIGSLTSSVTSMSVPPPITLYGTKAAAITNSSAYQLAVRRNSMIGSVDYDTANSVLDALASKSVDISLLDAFVTAAKNDKIEQKKLKVKEVIKSTSANGIVLSHELVRLEEDFKSQIASKQNIITEFVSNMTNLLKVAEEDNTVILLLDPKSSMFWQVLKIQGILASTLVVAGFIVSYFFKWRYHKNNRLVKPDPRLAIAESMDADVQNFVDVINNISDDMCKKHRQSLHELMWLKKNYERYLKRRAHYAFHDISESEGLPKPEI